MSSLNSEASETRNIILEYIWLDGKYNLRSKYRTIQIKNLSELDINQWYYDGRATHQIKTDDTHDVILNPVAFYNNPFFDKGSALIVLCDTFMEQPDGKYVPMETNNRVIARELLLKNNSKKLEPWFSFEQEYFITNAKTYHDSNLPKFPGDYYCGVGNNSICNRKFVEKHYTYCILAGLKMYSMNASLAPNQWKFCIGSGADLSSADELIVARYILLKLGEEYGLDINFKRVGLPVPWNNSHCAVNFSINETRETNGIDRLYDFMTLLENKSPDYNIEYNINSEEVNSNKVILPNQVVKTKCGYLKDNRPPGDCDPYKVISLIFQICCCTNVGNENSLTSS